MSFLPRVSPVSLPAVTGHHCSLCAPAVPDFLLVGSSDGPCACPLVLSGGNSTAEAAEAAAAPLVPTPAPLKWSFCKETQFFLFGP